MLSSEGADPHEVEASELTEMSGHDTTWEDMPDFPCLVASSVLKKYNQLSARGKPLTGTEWTPLAAILQYDGVCVCCSACVVLEYIFAEGTSCVPKVVAMGTGSKCIGESKMSKEGVYIIIFVIIFVYWTDL